MHNKKGKVMSDFTWSYSSLKQYQNCPRQYHEIRVLKNYTIKGTFDLNTAATMAILLVIIIIIACIPLLSLIKQVRLEK